MKLYRDHAVVLRQHKLGEADRIVTLLTRNRGLVRAVAKGVRRTGSRFGARVEPFAYIDVQLYAGRNLDTITQVHTVETFAPALVADYGCYTTACAVLETAQHIVGEEGVPAPLLHALTVGALRAIADGRYPRELVFDAFVLRAMTYAGWAPAVAECARCNAAGPHEAFHIAAGGAVCQRCRPAGATVPAPRVWDLLAALTKGDWTGIEEFSGSVRRQTSGLLAAHMQWHVEREMRTLRLIDRTPTPTG